MALPIIWFMFAELSGSLVIMSLQDSEEISATVNKIESERRSQCLKAILEYVYIFCILKHKNVSLSIIIHFIHIISNVLKPTQIRLSINHFRSPILSLLP